VQKFGSDDFGSLSSSREKHFCSLSNSLIARWFAAVNGTGQLHNI